MSHEAAIELLTNAAETCEQNAKINEQEGDFEQAALNTSNAQEYRNAIDELTPGPKDPSY